MKKITKAVIPAGGLGTRVLPATKALPKEMLIIVDKPAIQHIVEEAVDSGITDILIVINRGKTIIEDHFDKNPELETNLIKYNKIFMLEQLRKVSKLANIFFVRQKEAKGLGHAVSLAKSFVGNNPFAVLYGDDVIASKTPVCAQLIKAYQKYELGVVGAKEVPEKEISSYGSLKVEHIEKNYLKCFDMIEKPRANQILSLYSVLGRCVLPPEIFEILENTKPGRNDEIQLTDAMKILANLKGMIAVDFEGKRYDMGNKLGVMKAQVEFALNHPEIGLQFKNYLMGLNLS